MRYRQLTTITKHVTGTGNIILIGILCLFPGLLAAQITVTFRLDLSQETAKHFFRPDSDSVELLGDIAPLSMKKGLLIPPSANSEGVYSVTMEFPQIANGKILTFKYALRLNGYLQPENDQPARRISLHIGKRLLPVAHFQMHFQVFDSELIIPHSARPVRYVNPINELFPHISFFPELTNPRLASGEG